MSRSEMVDIACPKCGKPGSFEHWASVNVTLDPTLKDRLVSGELSRFECAQCGESVQVTSSLLYHDMQREFMIWFVPADPDRAADAPQEELPPMPGAKRMGGYRFRQVPTRNALLDKIHVFEAGLNDVVIELIKVVLPSQLPADVRPNVVGIWFMGLAAPDEGGGEKTVMQFAVVVRDGKTAMLTIDPGVYDDIDRDLPTERKNPAGVWPRVDETTIAALTEGELPPPAAPAPPRRGLWGRLFRRG